MKKIIINGEEYSGEVAVLPNKLNIVIPAEMSNAFEWDKEMTVVADGIEYSVIRLTMLILNGEYLQVEWDRVTEISVLEEQLERKQAELDEAETDLTEKNSRLSAVRDAITALGTGVPTLTKLLNFLTAVKEAIHYDGSNTDD